MSPADLRFALSLRWVLGSLLALQLTVSAARATGLDDESSAYLRAHARDAVRWMPWSDAAFTRARSEKKPIFVNVGSFTSELTRAMHRQSFANPQIARTLNEDFVSILVDRDERPDLAAAAQGYLESNKQVTGWPANLWLTPDLKPFEGANYLPPSEEWGKEGVANVLQRVLAAWKASPEAMSDQGDGALATLKSAVSHEPLPMFEPKVAIEALERARSARLTGYDAAHAGFGEPPRYPEPELLRSLLSAPGPGRDAALATLSAVDRSPMRDPLEGGFFSRSSDRAWQFPTFQKTLGLQARLACAFLDAAQLPDGKAHAAGARSALDYALASLADSRGGFVHAEDASPDDLVLGLGWTWDELLKGLAQKESESLARALGADPSGNVSADNDPGAKWKGKNLLSLSTAKAQTEPFASALKRLRGLREQRLKWLRDENVQIGENGLFLLALSRAALELKEPRYLEAAKALYLFFLSDAATHNGQLRRFAYGRSAATADDYASVALGCAALHHVAPELKAEATGRRLLRESETRFFDPGTGSYFAGAAGSLIFGVRPHLLPPAPGEAPAAETIALLAYSELNTPRDAIPPSLWSSLTAQLNDDSGVIRGDVLFTATVLLRRYP